MKSLSSDLAEMAIVIRAIHELTPPGLADLEQAFGKFSARATRLETELREAREAMSDGLKLVDIMSRAAPVDRNYRSDRRKWTIRRISDLDGAGLELVQPHDVEPAPTLLALPAPRA